MPKLYLPQTTKYLGLYLVKQLNRGGMLTETFRKYYCLVCQ